MKHTHTQEVLGKLDPLLMHKSRLGICALLAQSDALTFSRLKELLGETDGNLGAQLRKLEESNYVKVKKAFQARKPVSWYSLKPAGRKALDIHLGAIAGLIEPDGAGNGRADGVKKS